LNPFEEPTASEQEEDTDFEKQEEGAGIPVGGAKEQSEKGPEGTTRKDEEAAQPAQTQYEQRRTGAATMSVQKFFGDTEKDKQVSKDFLKDMRNLFRSQLARDATGAEKIEVFGDQLGTGSPAEKWYEGLGKSTKEGEWKAFEALFLAKFPTETDERGVEEVQRELLGLELRVDDLMKAADEERAEVWPHVVLANRIARLVSEVTPEISTQFIWQVKDKLPGVVRDRLTGSYTTWTAFTTAIKGVDITTVKEAMKRERELEEMKKVVSAIQAKEKEREREWSRRMAEVEKDMVLRRPPDSPTAPLRHGLTSISISGASGGARSGLPRANLFGAASRAGTRAVEPEVTPELCDRIRDLIARYPVQPMSDQGMREYGQQIKAWMERHPNTRLASWETGYPLRPGTKPVCSKECWQCGQGFHKGEKCISPEVPQPERWWRSYCARTLGQAGTGQVTAVQWVGDLGDNDSEYFCGPLASQVRAQLGKGEGPSV
jgi:hypothetical protein